MTSLIDTRKSSSNSNTTIATTGKNVPIKELINKSPTPFKTRPISQADTCLRSPRKTKPFTTKRTRIADAKTRRRRKFKNFGMFLLVAAFLVFGLTYLTSFFI